MGYIRYERDNDVLVVDTGGIIQITSDGNINIEDGGEITVYSGGAINVATGGDITVEDGGKIVWAASGATSSESGSTTLSEFTNSGVSFITSSGDVRKFTIDAPYEGADKWLFNTAGSTAMEQYYSVGSAGIITTGGDSTAHMMVNEGTTSGALAGWCHLVGKSTSRWIRVAHSPTSQWVIVSTSS